MFETLEQRRFLTSSISGGVLTVDGTSSGETINLYWNATGTPTVKVTINGVNESGSPFTVSSFNSVVIWAKNGADTIDCHAITSGYTSYSSLKPVTANGEAGADIIYGSDSADTLTGGSSNDQIMGNGGNDELFGNNDDDTLDGGSGADSLYGGTGADIFYPGRSDNNAFVAGSDTSTDRAWGNDASLTSDGSNDYGINADGSSQLFDDTASYTA